MYLSAYSAVERWKILIKCQVTLDSCNTAGRGGREEGGREGRREGGGREGGRKVGRKGRTEGGRKRG